MEKLKTALPTQFRWQPAGPLWQRAPSKQADGAPLADLMMLIPGLKHYTPLQLTRLQSHLESVVTEFGKKIVFSDINLKLNVVWVTLLPEPGLCHEVALAIRKRIPEAVMVGNQLKTTSKKLKAQGWRGWRSYMKRVLLRQSSKAILHKLTGRKLIDDPWTTDKKE
jgi:hypothetical protein